MALTSVNTNLLNIQHDDIIWRQFAVYKFNLKYWQLASHQPRVAWKICYKRLLQFEKILTDLNMPLWTEDDYYEYWKTCYPHLY